MSIASFSISSMQNPFVKQVHRLKNKRDRDKLGLFTIEGYRELQRAVESSQDIQTLLFCPELFLGENEFDLIEKIVKSNPSTKALEVSREVFEKKLSYRDRPDGLIAIAPVMKITMRDFEKVLDKSPLIVVAESIEKPGNLGSILRSCDAAGVDGLILCDPCTDRFNPNVIRASIGTVFTVPILECSLQELFVFLRKHNIPLYAASPAAEKNYTQEAFDKSAAIAVGCEQLGLSGELMEGADSLSKIPMLGKADSLNVAAATTLYLFEAVRQRMGSFDEK